MPADESALAGAIHFFESRDDAIRNGALPSANELLDGHSFFRSSAELDFQQWQDLLAEEHPEGFPFDEDAKLAAALYKVRVKFEEHPLRVALSLSEKRGQTDYARRMLVYLACHSRSSDARARLSAIVLSRVTRGAMLAPNRLGLAMALATGPSRDSMRNYMASGMNEFRFVAGTLQRMDTAATDETLDHLVEEDRAEFFSDKPAGAPGEPSAGEQLVNALFDKRRPGAMVVGKLPEAVGYKREIFKTFGTIAGKKLPFTPLRDLAGARQRLQEGWPHAGQVIDQIFLPLASRTYVRIQPTLLVGTPGSGKSALAMAICRELGLPVHLIGLGGAADSSIGGTSAQWHSARPNVVLQHIVTDRLATIGIVWDEVDKASDNRHNGSAFDSLLGMLEIDQAKRFRDPALELEVDLSHVTHIATANDLATVPAPLKDRMRVLQVPTPTWQHVGPLVQKIVSEILAQRGMSAWQTPFGQDEMSVLEVAWTTSPSFRSFRRVIDDMLTRREQLWGRA